MDHHPKQILNPTRDCMSAALIKALSYVFSHFLSVSIIRTNTFILQKLGGYFATKAKCKTQCFQKERLGETHLVPPTLKAMITFVSATYYLFLKPYNHD